MVVVVLMGGAACTEEGVVRASGGTAIGAGGSSIKFVTYHIYLDRISKLNMPGLWV